MRIKSKFSPIVVIGFLIFSMSTAASGNLMIIDSKSICRQFKEINRAVDRVMGNTKLRQSGSSGMGEVVMAMDHIRGYALGIRAAVDGIRFMDIDDVRGSEISATRLCSR
jgi:hypothetical protein